MKRVLFLIIILLSAISSKGTEVRDTLNHKTLGVSTDYYVDFSGKSMKSPALYAGNAAFETSLGAIRFRKDVPAGLVTTHSGGKIKQIILRFTPGTKADATIEIYGKNKPYTSSSDLHTTTKKDTLIATVCKAQNTLYSITPKKDYTYLGLRVISKNVCRFTSIIIVWETGEDAELAAPILTASDNPFVSSTNVSISSQYDVYYTLNGTEPTTSSPKYTDGITIDTSCTITAMATDGTHFSPMAYFTVVKTSANGSAGTPYTVADVLAVANSGLASTHAIHVKGIVSEIGMANAAGKLSYAISDDGTQAHQLSITNGLNANSRISLSDEVVIAGILGFDDHNTPYITPGSELMAVVKQPVNVRVSPVGYATLYYSDRALVVPTEVEAYTYRLQDDNITVSHTYREGDVIPMGEAVVIKAPAGDYTFATGGTAKMPDADNLLLGTDVTTVPDTDANSYFYALSLNAQSEAKSVGFYWIDSEGKAFSNGAHKAYLKIAKDSNAKSAILFNKDTATAISGIHGTRPTPDTTQYNLAGQRIGYGYKGIVIQNGKKHIKK